jgi:alpha-1,2-mannosyltransferase
MSPETYGYFHPYCNAGGGGERVLWQAVEDTLNTTQSTVVVYTGDPEPDSLILSNVSKRFDIKLDPKRVSFVRLSTRWLVDPATWPVLTLLGQAVGSIILVIESLWKFEPDIWIDTMGYPFTYFIVYRWLGAPIVAYVHFPVISQDMLNKLNPWSNIKQFGKFIYWKLFMWTYSACGPLVDITLTNSTWTSNHIKSIWKKNKVDILYPPCSTEKFITGADLEMDKWNRENSVVCLAQYRPEKRHDLIIVEYSKFLEMTEISKAPKLIFIGSIRSEADSEYVQELRSKAKDLNIPESHIKFVLDAPHSLVKEYLKTSSYGLNAMWNEHFGIAVVEYVASGLIPIVHASAGPLLDIVTPWDSETKTVAKDSKNGTKTGFFFKSKQDPDFTAGYPSLSEAFQTVAELSDDEKVKITKRGRESVLKRFSDEEFDRQWEEIIQKVSKVKKRNVEGINIQRTIGVFFVCLFVLWILS